jgi:hypothetical protein
MRIEPGTNPWLTRAGRVNPCAQLLGLIAVFCLAMSLALAANSQVGNSVKGFKSPLEYFEAPNERQVKSYIECSEAEFLSNGLIGMRNAKLLTYHEDGSVEMIATAPQCIYDTRLSTVSSTGQLQVQTVDPDSGLSFRHEGVGFCWLQTNSDLTISNQVITTIIGTTTNLFTP